MTVKHSGSIDGNENPDPHAAKSSGLVLLSTITSILNFTLKPHTTQTLILNKTTS